jgi:hypothetical protein
LSDGRVRTIAFAHSFAANKGLRLLYGVPLAARGIADQRPEVAARPDAIRPRRACPLPTIPRPLAAAILIAIGAAALLLALLLFERRDLVND